MRAAVTIISILLFVLACKKDKDEGPVNLPVINGLTDFALVPVSDAEWNIHIQGINNGGKTDTSHHVYVTINAIGADTMIHTRRYYKYAVNIKTVSDIAPAPAESYTTYIREDTAARVVYMAKGEVDELFVVTLKDEEVGKIVNAQPRLEIKYVDSVIMEKQYLKRWVICNSYDKNLEYFYKGYGMCTQTGILPRNIIVPAGGQVVEVSFRFKNSIQKFVNSVLF